MLHAVAKGGEYMHSLGNQDLMFFMQTEVLTSPHVGGSMGFTVFAMILFLMVSLTLTLTLTQTLTLTLTLTPTPILTPILPLTPTATPTPTLSRASGTRRRGRRRSCSWGCRSSPSSRSTLS